LYGCSILYRYLLPETVKEKRLGLAKGKEAIKALTTASSALVARGINKTYIFSCQVEPEAQVVRVLSYCHFLETNLYSKQLKLISPNGIIGKERNTCHTLV
jgi:hypothetical protein